MTVVHTQYGPGEIVASDSVRGRRQYKVAGPGFEIWVDETKVPGHLAGIPDNGPQRSRHQRQAWADVDFDHSVDLPYNPDPQYPAIPGDTEATIQPIHEIDPDRRLRPSDSITFDERAHSLADRRGEPGPNPELFAKSASRYYYADYEDEFGGPPDDGDEFGPSPEDGGDDFGGPPDDDPSSLLERTPGWQDKTLGDLVQEAEALVQQHPEWVDRPLGELVDIDQGGEDQGPPDEGGEEGPPDEGMFDEGDENEGESPEEDEEPEEGEGPPEDTDEDEEPEDEDEGEGDEDEEEGEPEDEHEEIPEECEEFVKEGGWQHDPERHGDPDRDRDFGHGNRLEPDPEAYDHPVPFPGSFLPLDEQSRMIHRREAQWQALIPLIEGLGGEGAAAGGAGEAAGGGGLGGLTKMIPGMPGGGGGSPIDPNSPLPIPDISRGWEDLVAPKNSSGGSEGALTGLLGKNASYRPAGLDDRYIDLQAAADHYHDPVTMFRDDPAAYINRTGHVHDEGLNPRFAEYGHLVEADKHLREAAWKDVRAKAMRLRREGHVHVEDIDYDRIYARVQGDHGVYDTMIKKGQAFGGFGGGHAISNWHCSCEWGKWAFRRRYTYVGRLCSHGYAAYLEMQSAHVKGKKRLPRQTPYPKRRKKKADALQLIPQRLVPELIINDQDDAEQLHTDVTKDERKTTGPGQIVHFANVMTHCDRNGLAYPRELVAYLVRTADTQQEEYDKAHPAEAAERQPGAHSWLNNLQGLVTGQGFMDPAHPSPGQHVENPPAAPAAPPPDKPGGVAVNPAAPGASPTWPGGPPTGFGVPGSPGLIGQPGGPAAAAGISPETIKNTIGGSGVGSAAGGAMGKGTGYGGAGYQGPGGTGDWQRSQETTAIKPGSEYTIKPGETLTDVQTRIKGGGGNAPSIADLAKGFGATDPNQITPGMKYKTPGASSGTPSSVPGAPAGSMATERQQTVPGGSYTALDPNSTGVATKPSVVARRRLAAPYFLAADDVADSDSDTPPPGPGTLKPVPGAPKPVAKPGAPGATPNTAAPPAAGKTKKPPGATLDDTKATADDTANKTDQQQPGKQQQQPGNQQPGGMGDMSGLMSGLGDLGSSLGPALTQGLSGLMGGGGGGGLGSSLSGLGGGLSSGLSGLGGGLGGGLSSGLSGLGGGLASGLGSALSGLTHIFGQRIAADESSDYRYYHEPFEGLGAAGPLEIHDSKGNVKDNYSDHREDVTDLGRYELNGGEGLDEYRIASLFYTADDIGGGAGTTSGADQGAIGGQAGISSGTGAPTVGMGAVNSATTTPVGTAAGISPGTTDFGGGARDPSLPGGSNPGLTTTSSYHYAEDQSPEDWEVNSPSEAGPELRRLREWAEDDQEEYFGDMADHVDDVQEAVEDAHEKGVAASPLVASRRYADALEQAAQENLESTSDRSTGPQQPITGGIKRAGKAPKRPPVVPQVVRVHGGNGRPVRQGSEPIDIPDPYAKTAADFGDYDEPQQMTAAAPDEDVVAAFQRSAAAQEIMSSSGGGGGDDFDIAEAAAGFLRTAGRNYSLAEQHELMNERHPLGARNLNRLDLEGTHYEAENSVGLW